MTSEDTERYRRAQAIAHDVLDRPPGGREACIAAACADDADLRREVEWLVAAAEISAPDGKLESIGEFARGMLDDSRIEATAPRQYRLIERIGEGGMGQVWLAERDDGTLHQRVALKMLRGTGIPAENELARFVAEGRILASLNHPNIAHLVDAGRGTDGSPFLAMEYIAGERIDRWCNAHALSLRERIDLFLKVCSAVEYAHARLVIHRDLKPVNILVAANGEPKLLDFGIARLLDRADGGGSATTVLRAMTLAYASPEQVEGKPLGTATDVYSLGVLLYELLAGVRPFDHLDSEHARSNAIVSGEVTPPSRARKMTDTGAAASSGDEVAAKPLAAEMASAASPRRLIPADVDAIVLKALRREPAQRYASVAEFADDLRRYLGARPVRARRGVWWYRSQRFLWRNRWSLAAACVLLVSGASWLSEREAQRHRIEVERDRAEAIARFTGDLFDDAGSLPTRGNAVSVREMLDRGADELQKRTNLSPAIKGSLLLTMGRAYNSLSLGKEALPLLQSARDLLASDDLFERARQIGAIGIADELQGRHPEAIAAYGEAIELMRSVPGDHAQEIAEWRVRIAGMHADMVDQPIERSIGELQQLVDELEQAPQRSGASLVRAYSTLSQAFNVANDSAHSIPMAEKAAALATRTFGANDVRASRARKNFALALMDTEPARAAPLLGELIAEYDRFSSTPSIARAGLLYNYGKSLRFSGQLAEAATAMEQAVATARDRGGPRHRLTLVALDELGVIYNLSGMPEKTEAVLGQALPDFAAAAAEGSDGEQDCHAMALATLGEAERIDGRHDQAAAHFAQADQILGRLDVDGFKDDMLDLLEWNAQLQLDRRDFTAARSALDRYDALMQRQSPVSEKRAAKSRALRAQLPAASGDAAGGQA